LARLTVRLTLECNNACLFCAQRGLIATPRGAEVIQADLAAARVRGDEVSFVGGEPTLVPSLADWIVAARRLEFSAVGLQTNGRRLAEPGFVQRLAEAGLTDIHLSIHGAEAAVHDYHVGRAGAFAAILAALPLLRSRGLTTVVTTVLTRSNARVLAGLPPLLKSAGVAGWLLTIPRVAGALTPSDDRVSPRFGIALPFALQALALARQAGLPTWIQGAPLCLLGPYAAHVLPDEPREYGEVCGACPARGRCPGLDRAYLNRFQGDELAPRDAVPAAPLPRVASLFVGVGELAPTAPAQPEARRTEPAPHPLPLTQLGGAPSGAPGPRAD